MWTLSTISERLAELSVKNLLQWKSPVRKLIFTFESEELAKLFAQRLRLYLKLESTREHEIQVTVEVPEIAEPQVERLARGSYASFKQVKEN